MTDIDLSTITPGDKIILESASARIDSTVRLMNKLPSGDYQVFVNGINEPLPVMADTAHSYWEVTEHTVVKELPTTTGSVVVWANRSEVAILVSIIGHGSRWEYKGKMYHPYELSALIGDKDWETFVSATSVETDTRQALKKYILGVNSAINSRSVRGYSGRKEDETILTHNVRYYLEHEANKLGVTL